MERVGVCAGFIWPTIRTSDGWDVVQTVMKGEKIHLPSKRLAGFQTNSVPQSKLQTYRNLRVN